jgi:hypothetical protein
MYLILGFWYETHRSGVIGGQHRELKIVFSCSGSGVGVLFLKVDRLPPTSIREVELGIQEDEVNNIVGSFGRAIHALKSGMGRRIRYSPRHVDHLAEAWKLSPLRFVICKTLHGMLDLGR